MLPRLSIKIDQQPIPTILVGNKDWLPSKNIQPRDHKPNQYLGQFKVVKQTNPVAFKFQLPETLKMYPVFHIPQIKPFIKSPFPDHINSPPPPVIVEGHEEYIIKKVLDSKHV